MSHIKIRGGHSLHGEIEVQGAKNAALPIIAASVLNNGMVHLRRCPQIMDVHHMLRILQQSGARIMWDDGDVWIKTDQMDTVAVSSLDAGKCAHRSSFWERCWEEDRKLQCLIPAAVP